MRVMARRAGTGRVPRLIASAAQGLVALVLGAVAASAGIARGQLALAGVFAAVALLGLVQVVRTARERGSRRT